MHFFFVLSQSQVLLAVQDQAELSPEVEAQINVHTNGMPLLGTAIGDDTGIGEFLRNKLSKIEATLKKMKQIGSLQSRYEMLKLLINSTMRHLLRSRSSTRQPVLDFCVAFDQLVLNHFAYSFHVQNPSNEPRLHAALSAKNAGMGLLSLQHMAPCSLPCITKKFTHRIHNQKLRLC